MSPRARKARICCLDLDTFFVSVERLFRPDLIGKPVVVGATPGKRGVVTAASYEVREYGVKSGMPIAEAYRLAPHAVFLSGRHSEYSRYASQVKEILQRFSPEVRTASIDEFFIDFSQCEAMYRSGVDIDDEATVFRVVSEMRATIQSELGLPASAGVAAVRPLAKVASGSAKPAGVKMVRVGDEYDFVAEMPVRRWPGIGPVAAARLAKEEVHTLGDLLTCSGEPAGSVRRAVFDLETTALGRDRPAFREHDPEGLTQGSISNECTFAADIGQMEVLRDRLCALCERVCWRMRRRQVFAGTITLKIRYSDFETLTRARSITPTNDDGVVFACVRKLFRDNYNPTRRVRLLGVALSKLRHHERQLTLPFDGNAKPAVARAMDAVREQFGFDSIHFGMKSGTRWKRDSN